MKRTIGFAVALVGLGFSTSARAQDPAFAHAGEDEAKKLEELEGVEWKAAALAGFILTTGNSETTTLSAGATASRKEGRSKLAADAGLAYARSTLLFPNDINGNGTIDSDAEIGEDAQTTTDSWLVKARYDFFFTPRNSVYASASVSADEPAGKELVAGGQVGYSRLLHKSEKHEVVAEVGYDYSFEDPVVGDGQSIHSGRGFVGWAGKLSADTTAEASLEALSNVNKLDTPPDGVDRFEDTRVNGKSMLTTTLWQDLKFGFSFTLKYDNAPSPRPPLSIPYADGFVPLAEELDTRTEVSLIYNFL